MYTKCKVTMKRDAIEVVYDFVNLAGRTMDLVQEKFWLSQRAHIHLAALRWTFSRANLCFCRWGDHTGTENSRRGLTSDR